MNTTLFWLRWDLRRRDPLVGSVRLGVPELHPHHPARVGHCLGEGG